MTAKVITVSGGFSGSVVVDIVDSLNQLGSADFLTALTVVGEDDPPPVGDVAWKAATATTSAGVAAVEVPVDETQPLGAFNVAVDVVAGGRHEVVWALERSGSNRRALVVIT